MIKKLWNKLWPTPKILKQQYRERIATSSLEPEAALQYIADTRLRSRQLMKGHELSDARTPSMIESERCPKCNNPFIHDGALGTNCDRKECHFSTRPRLL